LIERVWPSIFEWNLAYTFLWINFPLYQWADTVGFWGLSTWMYIAQASVAYAVIIFKSDRKQSAAMIASTLAVVAGLTYVGHLKGKTWSKTDQKTYIGVAQGNIGNAEKIQSEKKSQFHAHIRGIYTQLTEDLIKSTPVDLMVWPETAMPFAFDPPYMNSTEQRNLLKSANQWGIPIVTGAYSLNTAEKDILGDPVIRNSVFYVSPNMNYAAPPYYKTNLLAFGEYMPFGQTFPILYKLLPFVGVYAEGSGPVIADIALKGKNIKLGPQICYDSLNPGFSRDLAKNGAQVIYNVTNDSWFGWWAEPFQHQYMTLGRAIEVRRPLVRSTNTGISSAILADGTVLTESPINEPWAHSYEIKYKKNPQMTIYTKFGYFDWIIWLIVAASLVFTYRTKPAQHTGEENV
jgi:apolipoprotein N-acyltransferase